MPKKPHSTVSRDLTIVGLTLALTASIAAPLSALLAAVLGGASGLALLAGALLGR